MSDLTNWLQPNLVNPTIKYFSDPQAQTEVTNKAQKSGYLYVVITANDNDPNYQGATNPIKISLKQYKLSDIQQLTGLNLIADSSKKFWEIEDEINNKADEFKNKIKINGLYSVIAFYDSPTSNNNLRLENQRKGNFWIVINASSLEPNWYGETSKIKITLK